MRALQRLSGRGEAGELPFHLNGNQPHLFEEIVLHFEDPQEPKFVINASLEHGRIEIRKIWTTSALNGYLDLPHPRQAFAIDRETIEKKTGNYSREIACGVTSRPQEQADARRVLGVNRVYWSIENSCHYILLLRCRRENKFTVGPAGCHIYTPNRVR